jgi:hypothetical protein
MPDPRVPQQKPWPMKWIVLAIVIGISVYTYLTLHYRKPGPEYRPYEDFLRRANVERLLKAGYRRIEVPAELPADPDALIRGLGPVATVTDVAGGLPGGLAGTFVEAPRLAPAVTTVSAPRQVAASQPCRVFFNCSLPDQKEELSGAQVFIRDNTIAIVPQFEPVAGDLVVRTKESVVAITLPGGVLHPGRYIVTLAATRQSKRWTLEVK